MKLGKHWRSAVKYYWSFRLAILAALLSGAEVFLQFTQDDFDPLFPKGVFAAIAGLVSVAAAIARLVAQKRTVSNKK